MPTRPDERRREELLADLETIMLDEGFAQWRVGTLAARLRCSRTTLYRLAPSKDALIHLLVDGFAGKGVAEARAESLQQPSPSEAIIRYAEVINRWHRKGSPRFWADIQSNEATRSLIEEDYAKRGADVVQAYLDQGVEMGLFRPANTAFIATLMWRSARLTRDPALLESLGLNMADAMEEFARLFVYGMGWPPAED